MKYKIGEQLNHMGNTLHNEAKRLSDLRKECVKVGDYKLAGVTVLVEKSTLEFLNSILNHLNDLKSIPPDGDQGSLFNNVD